MPRQAEAAHVRDGEVVDRFKWQYHYLQTFFASGTHYVILDCADDCPDFTSLGPSGTVVANGQGMMFPRLKGRIIVGVRAPAPLPSHRPRNADAYAYA